MPKYLFEVKYTAEGMHGLKSSGGSARVAASTALIEQLGGTLETFYFALGETDAYVIAELPDNVSVAAAALAVGATGGISSRAVVLLSPEEVDAAAGMQTPFRPPGP